MQEQHFYGNHTSNPSKIIASPKFYRYREPKTNQQFHQKEAYSFDKISRTSGIFDTISCEAAISGTRQNAERTVTDNRKYASRLPPAFPVTLPFPAPATKKKKICWCQVLKLQVTGLSKIFRILILPSIIGGEKTLIYSNWKANWSTIPRVEKIVTETDYTTMPSRNLRCGFAHFQGKAEKKGMKKYRSKEGDRESEHRRRRKSGRERGGRRRCRIWWQEEDRRGVVRLSRLSTASSNPRASEMAALVATTPPETVEARRSVEREKRRDRERRRKLHNKKRRERERGGEREAHHGSREIERKRVER